MDPSRRTLLTLATVAPTVLLARASHVQAQSTSTNPTLYDRDYPSIAADAHGLGLTVQASAPGQGLPGAELDLADVIEQAVLRFGSDEDAASDLAAQAGSLLSALTRAGSDAKPPDAAQAPPPNFGSIAKDYRAMFEGTRMAPNVGALARRAAARICSPTSYDLYKACEGSTRVPWYVVGAIHYREANLNFMGHLHNGDFLRSKTIHVPKHQPKGRWPPEPWVPRVAWLASATDALHKISNLGSWTVERTLYHLEGYNGFGYRYHRAGDGSRCNTPYLWNYTQFYAAGGYAYDGDWSDDYVSHQLGIVPLLKEIQAQRPSDVVLTYE